MPISKQAELEESQFNIAVEAKVAEVMRFVVDFKDPESAEAVLRTTLAELKPAYVSRLLLAEQVNLFRRMLPSIMVYASEPHDRVEALDRYLEKLHSEILTF